MRTRLRCLLTPVIDHLLCRFFLGHHAISKKLLRPLLLSRADYLIIMDSDIL